MSHFSHRRIVALIAVHNRLALTQRCVAALRQNSPDCEVRFVVVDDGSTDGTGDWLAAQADITTLSGDGNLWFGGATAKGLSYILEHFAEYDFLLAINNDTFASLGALGAMSAAASSGNNTVAAAAYAINDLGGAGSAGFYWIPWRGLRDVCKTPSWQKAHRSCDQPFIPVDAIATTFTLIPISLLQRTDLPDASMHPHERYDAVLSARLRVAGARFVCSSRLLADHLYGPMAKRPSVRRLGFHAFLREAFYNRRSIFHLAGNCELANESAPDRIQAAWRKLRLIVTFVRQAGCAFLVSVDRRVRSRKSVPA
jgi:GT2 family glycosyltransferase